MPGGAVYSFCDSADYETNLREMTIDLVVSEPGTFEAKLTRVDLPHMRLINLQETLPRIAHLSLPFDVAFITFPTRPKDRQVWSGKELLFGDFMFHGLGEHLFQRTTGPSGWGFIALRPDTLAYYGRALTGHPILPPETGQILRLPSPERKQLLQLHARIGRIAETRPALIRHPEVARAMEQEMIEALVSALTAGKLRPETGAWRSHVKTMNRLEETLAIHPDRPLPIAALCEQIGVSPRVLQSNCAQFLGMNPHQYIQRRRLKRVRAAILRANPATAQVTDLAMQFGFTELGRFAGLYRTAFGEMPLITLRRRKNFQ